MNTDTILHSFHFLRPWWLLALPLFWATAYWLARRQSGSGDWSQFIDAHLAPALRLDGSQGRSIKPWPLLALVWSLAVLALAGPSWQRDQVPAYRGNAAWLFLMDMSPSMMSADLAPDRITRARYALTDLLDAAHDARVGLIAFGAEPFTVTPLTDDGATVKALLPALTPDIMPTAGDHLAPALNQAERLLEPSGAQRRQLVVLTDGFDDPAAAFAVAAQLKARGISVNVVGVGTAAGAPLRNAQGQFDRDAHGKTVVSKLDEDTLRQLASSGGGLYVNIADLAQLIAQLQSKSEATTNAQPAAAGIEVVHWRDAGVWLLPLLLLSAALLARKDWL